MGLPGILRRASWNLIDQMISSGTNAVLSIIIARSVDESTFGSFAVAFTVYGFLVGASQAVSTAPLGVRFASRPPDVSSTRRPRRSAPRSSSGPSAGGVCIGAGLAIGAVRPGRR